MKKMLCCGLLLISSNFAFGEEPSYLKGVGNGGASCVAYRSQCIVDIKKLSGNQSEVIFVSPEDYVLGKLGLDSKRYRIKIIKQQFTEDKEMAPKDFGDLIFLYEIFEKGIVI